ncbi:MAG: cytochrome c maturation protein CcmE, partial [Gammaproteobacteria bacterium]|nr:cytochrome c maturation protein CcmE [Gammaproteobacteria bacterium]
MTPVRKKRILLIVLMVTGVAIATGFALKAFNENLMFFFSVSDVIEGKAPAKKDFRLGGMVVDGSVRREPDSLAVMFDLTDNAKVMTVYYDGILPDLFREGQGIISKGKLREDGVFEATEVLAKHDE